MSTHAESVRFAERILTSKGFNVTAGKDCDLLINGSIRVGVTGSIINDDRGSFYFRVGTSDCDVILCIGLREKTARQKITAYVIPAFEVAKIIKNIRIPADGWTQYMAFVNRFDLIEKMIKRREVMA